MNILEKVEKIISYYQISQASFAKKISVNINTFNRYIALKQEEKIKPYLWEIIKQYPEISRDWLFFDEGEMLKTENNNSILNNNTQNRNSFIENELLEERKINRQLQIELIEERKISRELQNQLNTITQDKAIFQKIAN